MVKSKDKGAGFERDLVKELNSKIKRGEFKKVPGSGAIGTIMHESFLTADVTGTVDGFPKRIKIECKVGYGGEKQLTLKREWLNKIKEQAEEDWSFPALIAKFSGARKADGIQKFVALDLDDFIFVLNLISDLSKELELSYGSKDTKPLGRS